MLSARTLLATLALASTGALAQLVNPIIRPTVGDTLYAGGTFDIIWNVTTPNDLVSLILRQGPSNNIGVVGTIADSIADSGSYQWNIPANLPSGNNYAIEIIIGPASNVSNVGPDGYNFTPLLPLVNNSTGPASNTTTTASAASPTSGAASASASGSGAAVSGSASETATTSMTAAASASGATSTASETSEATVSSSSTSSTATAKSSASTMDVVGGHGFIALVFAVVFGMVAAF